MFDTKIKDLGGIESVSGGDPIPMSESQIVDIENIIGKKFPPEYREFLKLYGACKFGKLAVFSPVEKLPDTISSSGNGNFNYFFGAVSDDDSYALQWAIEAYRDRMPSVLVPIGGDLGGGVICLGVDGEQLNKIYYWDPSNEWDLEDLEEGEDAEVMMFQNVYFVAENFAEFISRLEVSPFA